MLKEKTIDKIVLIIKNSPLYEEDEKEKILDEIRTEMHWLKPEWKEPSLIGGCGMSRK